MSSNGWFKPRQILVPTLWHLRKLWLAVNSGAVLVGALILFSLLVWRSVIVELQGDIVSLKSLPSTSLPQTRVTVPDADNLTIFLAFLPEQSDRLQYIDNFHRLADETGVTLLQADYQVIKNTRLPVSELTTRLILSGQAVAVRQYLDRLLVETPSLAIEHLAYEFSADTSANQARLTLDTRLYMRLANAQPVHHE